MVDLAKLSESEREAIELQKRRAFCQTIFRKWSRSHIESWLKKQPDEQQLRDWLNEIRKLNTL